jgi:hypothetical protein
MWIFFDTGSVYVAKAGLNYPVSVSQVLELQAYITKPSKSFEFIESHDCQKMLIPKVYTVHWGALTIFKFNFFLSLSFFFFFLVVMVLGLELGVLLKL